MEVENIRSRQLKNSEKLLRKIVDDTESFLSELDSAKSKADLILVLDKYIKLNNPSAAIWAFSLNASSDNPKDSSNLIVDSSTYFSIYSMINTDVRSFRATVDYYLLCLIKASLVEKNSAEYNELLKEATVLASDLTFKENDKRIEAIILKELNLELVPK